MSRRKGELSGARIDREFPYQVAVPEGRIVGKGYEPIHKLCAGLMVSPLKQTVFAPWAEPGGGYFSVFCFAKLEDAEAFVRRSSGIPFDPKRYRGKGARKRFWDNPPPNVGCQPQQGQADSPP